MCVKHPLVHHQAYTALHLSTLAAHHLHTMATSCPLHLAASHLHLLASLLHLANDSRCTSCTGTWHTPLANQFRFASQTPLSTTTCRHLQRLAAANQAAKVQPASPAPTCRRTRAPPRTASATRAGNGVALNNSSSSSSTLHLGSSSSVASSGSRLTNLATTPPPSIQPSNTILEVSQPTKTTFHIPKHNAIDYQVD